MVLYVRELSGREKTQLQTWLHCNDQEMRHRSRVILLSNEGYRIPEIGTIVSAHPANLRKWIHRFNEHGCEGLRTVHGGGRRRRFSASQRAAIIRLAEAKPRQLGLRFSRWTLYRLAAQAQERGIVDRISHESVRQILRQGSCDYRRSGTGLEL